MKYNIPAVLFAGGKSSRMGRDKALLPFAEYTSLSQYQYQRLSTLFHSVYLSAKENKFDFDASVIFDNYTQSSPLVGIVTLFETLEADEVFILSVDAPFVNKEVIDTLMKSKDGVDAVIARSKSGKQPLCGIYKRSLFTAAKENLLLDNHRIGNLLKNVQTRYVDFEEDALFLNLNHPHEYEEALNILLNI